MKMLSRFAALSREEKKNLLSAALLLPIADISLQKFGFRKTQQFLFRKTKNNDFSAHAWLELDGTPIIDDESSLNAYSSIYSTHCETPVDLTR